MNSLSGNHIKITYVPPIVLHYKYMKSGSTSVPSPVLVLSDSMIPPTATAFDETQLPCSPTQLPTTDVAHATLRELDAHDQRVQHEANGATSFYYLSCYTAHDVDWYTIWIYQDGWGLDQNNISGKNNCLFFQLHRVEKKQLNLLLRAIPTGGEDWRRRLQHPRP